MKISVSKTKKGADKVKVKRGKKTVTCIPKVNNPHESHGAPGWIDAKATVTCTGNGTLKKVVATILIQKKIDGKWKTIPATRNTRGPSDWKMRKQFVVMTGELKCAPGTYRARGKANVTVSGARLIMKKGWLTSGVARNPC